MMLHRSSSFTSPSACARVVLLASITALVLTTFEANAAPVARASAATGEQLDAAAGDEFGSRRRGRVRRGNAAGLAMMGMMIGTIGAVIAADQRRKAYRRAYHHPYGYGHGYAYPGPYGYYAPYGYHRPYVYGPNY